MRVLPGPLRLTDHERLSETEGVLLADLLDGDVLYDVIGDFPGHGQLVRALATPADGTLSATGSHSV